MSIFSECTSLHDYIIRAQVDAIMWKADKLLANVDQPLMRHDRLNDIARTLALLPAARQVIKDDYIQQISKKYNITRKTLEKYVADNTVIEEKKKDIVRAVRKNQVVKLAGDPKTFPFFEEIVTVDKKNGTKTFKGVTLNIKRFIELLRSFGFTRYSNDENDKEDEYTFVRVLDNVIKEVPTQKIIDYMEDFIEKEYDFDGAGCEFTDSEYLHNLFYNRLDKYFSKKLFARVRNPEPVIVNHDTAKECFIYYKNGFVRCTADGYELLPYEQMNGSVWDGVINQRSFTKVDAVLQTNDDGEIDLDLTFTDDRPLGDYADFIWRISGAKQQRYRAFCSILGYLMHDFYEYKLKVPFLTDSIISEDSNGRSGKSLSMEMLQYIRGFTPIDGKAFDQNDINRYTDADRSTQILLINDLEHSGKYKFNFERMYNEILNGYKVKKLFLQPFTQRSKIALTSNKSINFKGDSMLDRVIEFEVSNFFSSRFGPDKYYGRWFGTGWDEAEWHRFDNFLCTCSCFFLRHGLISPDTINLEARKLLDSTSREFVDFMNDIVECIARNKTPWQNWDGWYDPTQDNNISLFEFDKTELFNRFVNEYPDWKAFHLSQKRFTTWLRIYSTNALKIKTPIERRGNGKQFIQFKESTPNLIAQ